MPRNERQKANKSKKTPMKALYIKTNDELISTKSPKSPLRPWAETWIRLSQKRTLGIEEPELKFRKKGMQEDSYEKEKKSKSTKVLKWHGNEEQMNIPVYHMLQSCGVQAGSYLRTKVKWNSSFGLNRVIRTWKSWFPLSQIGLSSMIKGTYIYHLINPDSWKNSISSFVVKTVYHSKNFCLDI